MSDAFLNKMNAKEYNAYHRELFGDEWEDVEFERRPSLFKMLLIKLKLIKNKRKKEETINDTN